MQQRDTHKIWGIPGRVLFAPLCVVAFLAMSCSGSITVSGEIDGVDPVAKLAGDQVTKALQRAGVKPNPYWVEACGHAVAGQWDSARRALAQAALSSGLDADQKKQLQTMFTFAAGMPGLPQPVTSTFGFLSQALSMSPEEMSMLARLASPGYSTPGSTPARDPTPVVSPTRPVDTPTKPAVTPARPVANPVVSSPPRASDQCDGTAKSVWLSLDGAGALSIALPFGSPMYVETVGSTWYSGLSLHVQDTLQLSLTAGQKTFKGANKFRTVAARHEYILESTTWNFLTRAFVPVLRKSQWDLQVGGLLGLGRVQRPAVRYVLDFGHEKVEYEKIVDPFTNQTLGYRPYKLGEVLDTSLWSVVLGAGARFVYFPVDFIGLFVQADLAWAVFHDFDQDPGHKYHVRYGSQHGAITLDLGLGAEIHF